MTGSKDADETIGAGRRDRPAFVGAREVAIRAGVSRSAVSRVFTPGASVSEETRRRVLDAAAALGYHVNHLARGLISRSTGIVCLIVADLETPQQARLLRALTVELQAIGKVAMVLSTDGRGEAGEAVLRQSLHYRADGTVVVSGTPAETVIRTCLDNGQRMVLINRDDRIDGPHNIRLDNATVARAALQAFVRGGCRRLAVVDTGNPTPSLIERETAFVAAARDLGLDVAVVREGAVARYEDGVAAGRRLFTASTRPDAVFCVNDILACGVMDAARREFGLRVPEDVSVIGCDNIRQSDWLSYQLTTFDQPIDAIVARTVELLGDDAPETPLRVVLPPTLVWRRSVRVPGTP
ncbi:LacI family DNA-binding transcriptional regulator [Methyloraptor flagellatus]|uniref:Substrate-binding domain-containing protein n=1 Tax=Methyloraptor flagellatus TaxID=3162530 RepID=A0AAU7XFN0_9HYPH